ncbi:general secretion pathway protein GspB [Solimonas variicoloris]|uniref:general secretion pathway protein GspB n=1 Tax=Solimonas variicoloris TaxID=254408 RepID=UPI0003758246|nr:general secretion pathway protein GspB [Solimonas variicoloris]
MSYILEALRRAERERQMGKAPSVEALTQGGGGGTAAGVPGRIWLLAGSTAAIAAAALALLLWPAPQPAPPAPGPVAAMPAPAAVSTTPETAPAAPPDTPPLPAAIEDDAALASLDDVSTPEPQPPATAVEAAPLQPQDVARPPAPETVPAPTPIPAGTTVVSGTAPASATILVPAGATVLREMPDAYRAQFPVAALDVHVYDADPARRWVMIAGKRYREGDTVAGGPLIERIVDNGVVFDYGGARVLMPVR